MLDRAAPQGHRIGIAAQAPTHLVDQVLMLPTGDAALLAAGAAVPDRTILTLVGPVTADLQAAFLPRVAVSQVAPGGAAVDIPLRVVEEVGLHEHALAAVAGGFRARHRHGDAGFVTGKDLGAAEVALVGDGMQLLAPQRRLGRRRHRAQLRAIEALIGDLVGHDQVGLGVDGTLDIVANQPAEPGAGRHRAGIGIGQGNLSVGGIGQGFVHCLEARDLLPDASVSAGEACNLLGLCLALLLTVDADHLLDVSFDIGLQMGQAAGDLALGKVAIAVVHRLEFAAVDGDAIPLQHPHPAAQFHELRAGPSDGRAVVAPEVGDGLVVGRQAAGQPHKLDIPPRFAFQAAAGWDPVQVAVDKELQQHGWMIARATSSGWGATLETECAEIELIDEEVDDTDQVILADPILEPLREKRDLFPVDAIDETGHPRLPFARGSLT